MLGFPPLDTVITHDDPTALYQVARANPPEQVFAMLADPAFREKVCAAQGVVSSEVRLTPSGALTEALSQAMTLSVDWFGLAVLAVWGAVAAVCALRWFRFT